MLSIKKRDYLWLALLYLVLLQFVPGLLFWSILLLGLYLASKIYQSSNKKAAPTKRLRRKP